MLLEKTSARIATLADQCVQCGLCLPVCPTYGLDRTEAESPRGRIAIAAALARGEMGVTASVRTRLDHCLGCLHCERVCPAQVQYGELLVATRALMGPSPARPRGLLGIIKRPATMRALRRLMVGIQLPRWKTSLQRWLPRQPAWRAALATLPALPPKPALVSRRTAPQATSLPRLALFPGCIASVDDAAAQEAAVTLLRMAGFRVSVLPAFCCGALDAHGGETAAAERSAQHVRRALEASDAEQLITVTPGCLGTLRRAMPGMPSNDPYALLLMQAQRLRFRPLAQRIALHVPCTQINVARSESALLQLLRRIPDLHVMPLSAGAGCCGAAGSHLLEFPERAARLRDATLQQALSLAPQLLLSSNIGCRLHLAAGLGADAAPLPTMHPLVLLAQQLDSSTPTATVPP